MVVNVQVYCSFIGNTGWNHHVRDFLSNLNHDIVNVKVHRQVNPRIEGVIVGKAMYDGSLFHDQLVKLTYSN